MRAGRLWAHAVEQSLSLNLIEILNEVLSDCIYWEGRLLYLTCSQMSLNLEVFLNVAHSLHFRLVDRYLSVQELVHDVVLLQLATLIVPFGLMEQLLVIYDTFERQALVLYKRLVHQLVDIHSLVRIDMYAVFNKLTHKLVLIFPLRLTKVKNGRVLCHLISDFACDEQI